MQFRRFRWAMGVLGLTVGVSLALVTVLRGVAPLSVEPELLDMGAIPDGSRVTQSARITNVSGKPVEIDRIRLGCRCSQAKLSARHLEPGESATLEIEVISPGIKGSAITFVEIALRGQSGALRVPVRYRGDAQQGFDRPDVDFGRVNGGDLPKRELLKTDPWGSDALALDAIELQQDVSLYTHSVEGKTVAITLPKTAPSGLLEATLRCQTRGGARTYWIPIHGYVAGPVYSIPPELFLSQKAESWSGVLRWKHRGDTRLAGNSFVLLSPACDCVQLRHADPAQHEHDATTDLTVTWAVDATCDCGFARRANVGFLVEIGNERLYIPVHSSLAHEKYERVR